MWGSSLTTTSLRGAQLPPTPAPAAAAWSPLAHGRHWMSGSWKPQASTAAIRKFSEQRGWLLKVSQWPVRPRFRSPSMYSAWPPPPPAGHSVSGCPLSSAAPGDPPPAPEPLSSDQASLGLALSSPARGLCKATGLLSTATCDPSPSTQPQVPMLPTCLLHPQRSAAFFLPLRGLCLSLR